MRILHVVGTLNRGGAETWLVQVLRHIDRTKFHLDFLVHADKPGAYDEEVKSLGARIIPCLAPANPLRHAYNFCRVLRDYGPYDCVHSHVHHYSGFVLTLAAIMGVPMRIAQSHSDTRSVDGASPITRRAYLAAMVALIHRFSTTGVAVSRNAAAALFSADWSSDPKWKIIPLGIDLRPFEVPIDRAKIRQQLRIRPDATVVGHVGRFVEVKNHRFIVRIAECLCPMDPRVVFLLVGDGPLRPEIQALVQSRGLQNRFIFAGLREDVATIMKGAMDCFVLPSLYEGFPLVLLEAQASGLPCVISNKIPKDIDLIHELIQRMCLRAPAREWAVALETMTTRSDPVPGQFAGRLAQHSIQSSVSRLAAVYDSGSLAYKPGIPSMPPNPASLIDK